MRGQVYAKNWQKSNRRKAGTMKKKISLFVIIMTLLCQGPMIFAVEPAASGAAEAGGVMDDSLRDIGIVLGAGFAGAILGLSTLSFVDVPSAHTKNIAVGGAVGIVLGVGIVVFSQVSRTASGMTMGYKEIPMNPIKYETLARLEFSENKIAKNYLKETTLGYNFSF